MWMKKGRNRWRPSAHHKLFRSQAEQDGASAFQDADEPLWFLSYETFCCCCRFSSKFKEGEVTTMHRDDLPVLKEILSHSVDPIEVILVHMCIPHNCSCFELMFLSSFQTAGLHPTAEQIEMFAYHLPDATLSNLIVSQILCKCIYDKRYATWGK